MKKSQISGLNEAVVSWLAFQGVVGFREMLKEGALHIPVGTYLIGQLRRDIHAEYRHPVLSGEDSVGRPRSIDFVSKGGAERVVDAIEMKWTSNTLKNLVVDICRLLLVRNKVGGSVSRYLLLAGPKNHLENNWINGQTNSDKGEPRENLGDVLLPIKSVGQMMELEIDTLPGKLKNYFVDFETGEMSALNFGLPRKFKISLEAKDLGANFGSVVWSVRPPQGRPPRKKAYQNS